MSVLHLQNLGITLGQPLLANLNLTVSKGDRVGLIAANGRGKSTLLSAIAGEIEATSGEIIRARGLRIGYVRQTLAPEALAATMYDYVLAAMPEEQRDYESWRVDVVLNDLEVPYEFQHKPQAELSGGWQRMGLIAAAWVLEPDLLLLDEPTNHLDLSRIGQLQNWLGALPRDLPVILTSHDRAFLDAVTNRTLFLRPENSRDFALSYTAARSALDEADAADARRHANDLNKAQQLRRQAAKLKNVGINSGSDLLLTKTKQLSARAEALESATKPAHKEQRAGAIKLTNSGTHAKALLALDELEVKTPDERTLYKTGKKWISPGDRVVLLGANGAGKTSLIRMVQAAFATDVAGLKCAATLAPAYADQQLSQLNPQQTPMQQVTLQFDVGDQPARAMLAGAGIDIRLQDSPLSALSGGQKARLALLILRLLQPNFYLLDEPTNHLDIEGQEALESELISQGAACLLVSHDRAFIQNVGNRFWWIKGKRLEEVDGPEPFLNAEMKEK